MAEDGWLREVQSALGRLQPPHVAKKRATILALVDARLAGEPEESVWRRADTCNRSTYHEKWKRDPVFAEVLELVTLRAVEWRETEEARALRDAARRLALASPNAVEVLVGLLASSDETQRRLAAGDLLDRASTATSTKRSASVKITEELTDDELAAIAAGGSSGAAEP